jgi:hypothetical protein
MGHGCIDTSLSKAAFDLETLLFSIARVLHS